MELVSASKMSKAEQKSRAFFPYSEKIKEVIYHIAESNREHGEMKVTHPMLVAREVKKTGYILITADRGLAGAFNANVIRALNQRIQERHKSQDEYTIIAVGRIGYDFCRKLGLPVSHSMIGLADHPTFSDIHELATAAVQMYVNGEIDELVVFYTHYESAISQQVKTSQLLPIVDIEEGTGSNLEYEYEPDAEGILNILLPQYAESLIFGAILNSKASEHASRMTAMKNATENAEEIIEELTLSYNRARQGEITQEIAEIIGGAAALK